MQIVRIVFGTVAKEAIAAVCRRWVGEEKFCLLGEEEEEVDGEGEMSSDYYHSHLLTF